MWLNHFEIDVIWTAFKEILKLHSHISVFWGFSWITVISEFSFLGIDPKKENPEITENLIFGSMMFKCMWVYFLISISTFSVLKQEKQQKAHWINLEGSDALKRQKYDTWIAMWLNHFETDFIWTAFKEILKLHFHFSVF